MSTAIQIPDERYELLSHEQESSLSSWLNGWEAREKQDADAMGEYIDDVLAWMMLSEATKGSYWNPRHFDNAHPQLHENRVQDEFGFAPDNVPRDQPWAQAIRTLMGEDAFHEEEMRSFEDIQPPDIGGPFRRTTVLPADSDGSVYTFFTCRTVEGARMRKWQSVLPKGSTLGVLWMEEAILKTGDRKSRFGCSGWSRAYGLRQSAKNPLSCSLAEEKFVFARVMNRVLADRYTWFVDLRSHEERTGIRLATDGPGVERIIAERDRPAGAHRRSALRHWVKEHWREVRHEPKLETKIRSHLRGAERFNWCGLHCTITPSQYDLERVLRDRLKPRERR
jgi:hypothetical protein